MARNQREADVLQNHVLVERERHVIEHDDRSARLVQRLFRRLRFRRLLLRHQYSNEINTCVTKKSTAITATDPATTETVVALPTPCVPPVVRKPT